MKPRCSGLTLVEIMVAVAIISVTVTLSALGWRHLQRRTELERARYCHTTLNAARTQYVGEHPFVNRDSAVTFEALAPYLVGPNKKVPSSLEEYTAGSGDRTWILDTWATPIECKPAF